MASLFCFHCWHSIEECLCSQLALQPVVTFTQDILSIFTGARRSSRITPIRVGMSDQEFINACFPYSHQAPLRDRLANLLDQPWLNSNYEEPLHALRFLLSEDDAGNPKCKICSRVLRRGGRALEHIRIHLNHTPFRCLGPMVGCSQLNCARVFHGRESMRDHQRKVQVQCNEWSVKCQPSIALDLTAPLVKSQSCARTSAVTSNPMPPPNQLHSTLYIL